MTKINKKNIIIAGGGTGGHIYPGVAIARAFQKLNSDYDVYFVGAKDGLENKIVPKEGYKLFVLDIGKLNYKGGFLKKIITILKFPIVFLDCVKLILKLKPEAVLGVGGYASGPFVFVASLMGYQTAIWEPNAFPGLTNRLLSRFVKKAFVVFSDAKGYLKSKYVVQVGLPVREQIESLAQLTVNQKNDFHILVFGGSQGARAINQAFSKAVLQGGDWLSNTHILHQTGSLDYNTMKSLYQNLNLPETSSFHFQEFIYDMDEQYKKADLVICRSGASTVAEIAASGRPCIFIPLPSAADDHQRKNAESLIRVNAAAMILQSDLTPETLIAKIKEVRENFELRKQFNKNLRQFYVPQSAQKLASQLLS